MEWLVDYLNKVICGDCLEIMKGIPDKSVDLVLTDPPYNVKKDYDTYNDSLCLDDYQNKMSAISSECLRIGKNQFWVAPRYKLNFWMDQIVGSHLVVIRRGAAGPFRGGWSDQFEIALATGKPNICYPDLWDDIRLKGEGYFFREETFGHPGYTPFKIMSRAIELFSPPLGIILDPFFGSGTTGVAAKILGRQFIGIEISEKYCEIARQRIDQTLVNKKLEFK